MYCWTLISFKKLIAQPVIFKQKDDILKLIWTCSECTRVMCLLSSRIYNVFDIMIFLAPVLVNEPSLSCNDVWLLTLVRPIHRFIMYIFSSYIHTSLGTKPFLRLNFNNLNRVDQTLINWTASRSVTIKTFIFVKWVKRHRCLCLKRDLFCPFPSFLGIRHETHKMGRVD